MRRSIRPVEVGQGSRTTAAAKDEAWMVTGTVHVSDLASEALSTAFRAHSPQTWQLMSNLWYPFPYHRRDKSLQIGTMPS